ncbi:MAG: response regulator transcription factor [Bacteroidetes bacterium]|nr:response regulator transcription factor [Bacteroidota bacterium]
MKIGILLFEDNNDLRESLCNMINFSKDLLLLGSYPDVSKVEHQVREANPDVILMDIDMPGRNGIEAVKIIRRFNQKAQIMMLTVFDDNKHIYDAICAGASGYLLKKNISDKLLTSIHEILQGEAPMSPGIARMIIQNLQQLPNAEENKYNLTPREKEILLSLSQGNSFKMIAAQLYISIDTIRTHSKNIYEKLQVHTQIEAVSKAINEKLL